MRKTINIDFDNSSSLLLGYDPDILGTKASAYALSTHSHGNVLLALTNLTGAVTSVSNGLTIALQAGTAGGGGTIHAGNNITLGTAVGHTTISAYSLADVTHNHGGAPSITGIIGGTIASDHWSLSIPDFLLTAAQSDHIHAYFSLTSTASVAGTNLTLSDNTAGITIGVPNFLTTAANSTHTHGSFLGTNITQISSGSGGIALSVPNFAGTQTSATNVSISVNTKGISIDVPEGRMYFVDASGVSWSTATSALSTSITAYYNSSHTHGNVSMSLDGLSGAYSSASNGLTISLTNSTHPHTDFAGLSTAATNVGLTVNSQGIRVSLDTAGLTSFGDGVNILAAGGSTAASNATIAFVNANRVSFSLNSNSISASIGEYIKTGFTTTATAGTAVVGTADSDGLKLGIPAFITTALDQSQMPGVISINGTSGSMSLSASRNISINSSEGSALTFYGPSNILNSFSIGGNTGTSGSSAISGGGFVIAGGSNITLSQSDNTISIHGTGGIRLGASDTTYQTGTVFISAGSNVTIGTTENAGIQYIKIDANITGSAAGDGYNIIAAGSQTAGTVNTIVFSDSNGVGFGMSNNSIITASYSQSTHEHSNLSLTQYIGLLTTNLIGASATIDNSQFQLDIPQGSLYYEDGGGISWGAVSSGLSTTITATIGGSGTGGIQLAGSAASTIATGVVQFANANGISFGLNSNTMTASYASDAYIGTAYLGYWQATEGSKGLMYTTYTQHTHGSNISWGNTTNTSETAMRASSSSNGLTIVVPPYITAAGAHTHGSNVSTATYTTGGTAATSILFSSASNGLTMSYPAYAVTSHTHSNLYANVTHGHGTVYTVSIGGSVLTNSSASSGLTLGIPAWITTAGSVSHTHGSNVSLSLTNLSGSASSASNGLTLSFTGYPATSFVNVSQSSILYFSDANNITWGSATAGSTTTITASFLGLKQIDIAGSTSGTTAHISSGTLVLAGGNNIVLSQNANSITISAVSAANNLSITAGTFSGTRNALSFANANGVSFTMNGSTISGSVSNNAGNLGFADSNGITFGIASTSSNSSTVVTASILHTYPMISWSEYPSDDMLQCETFLSNGLLLVKHVVEPFRVTASAARVIGLIGGATNTSATTASVNFTMRLGIYSKTGNTLTILSSGSASNGFRWSQSASTTANTSLAGNRQVTIPINVNLVPGEYWFALLYNYQSTYTTPQVALYNRYTIGADYMTYQNISGTGTSVCNPFGGYYTASTNVLPNSIVTNDVTNTLVGFSSPKYAHFFNGLYNVNY
jgi:hypothetical protein